MTTYKLNKDLYTSGFNDFALEIVDGVPTGVCVNIHTNQAYLKFLAEGNTPEPADEVTG